MDIMSTFSITSFRSILFFYMLLFLTSCNQPGTATNTVLLQHKIGLPDSLKPVFTGANVSRYNDTMIMFKGVVNIQVTALQKNGDSFISEILVTQQKGQDNLQIKASLDPLFVDMANPEQLIKGEIVAIYSRVDYESITRFFAVSRFGEILKDDNKDLNGLINIFENSAEYQSALQSKSTEKTQKALLLLYGSKSVAAYIHSIEPSMLNTLGDFEEQLDSMHTALTAEKVDYENILKVKVMMKITLKNYMIHGAPPHREIVQMLNHLYSLIDKISSQNDLQVLNK